MVRVFSIGHSNHSLDGFLKLLAQHSVQAVADIRSHPGSKHSPHFDQKVLEQVLPTAGVRYAFLGGALGGRPSQREFYDTDGHVLYRRIAQTAWFRKGIERVIRGAQRYRLAIMCSEEDPKDCHRRLLVGRVLLQQGIDVIHIRGDGRLQSDPDVDDSHGVQQESLFDGPRGDEWRSIRSVSPRGQQLTSSEH